MSELYAGVIGDIELLGEHMSRSQQVARKPTVRARQNRTDERLALANQIHEGLLLIQRRNRRLRLSMPFRVPAFDSIVLTFLSHNSDLSAGELITEWGLSKPTVSRIFKGFVETGLLIPSRTREDQRQKRYVFSREGQSFISALDDYNSKLILRSTAQLTVNQRRKLALYFSALNDGLGISKELLRPSEERLIVELFRISRGTGLLGENYMGTGHPVDEYQILFELVRGNTIEDFGKINEALPLSMSKISRIISSFEEKKWVIKSVPKEDKRKMSATLSPSGQRHFREHHERIAAEYLNALTELNDSQLDEFAALIYIATSSPLIDTVGANRSTEIVKTENERRLARKFLVEQLVALNRHGDLGADLLPERNTVILATESDTPLYLIELTRLSEDHYQVTTFVHSVRSDLTGELITELRETIRALKKSLKFKRLSVRPGLPPEHKELFTAL